MHHRWIGGSCTHPKTVTALYATDTLRPTLVRTGKVSLPRAASPIRPRSHRLVVSRYHVRLLPTRIHCALACRGNSLSRVTQFIVRPSLCSDARNTLGFNPYEIGNHPRDTCDSCPIVPDRFELPFLPSEGRVIVHYTTGLYTAKRSCAVATAL